MTYKVIWSERSKGDLEKIDKQIQKRIIAKAEAIKTNPFAHVKRLVGVKLFSLRIGDYRAIIDIQKNWLIIFMVRVGHRKRVYGIIS